MKKRNTVFVLVSIMYFILESSYLKAQCISKDVTVGVDFTHGTGYLDVMNFCPTPTPSTPIPQATFHLRVDITSLPSSGEFTWVSAFGIWKPTPGQRGSIEKKVRYVTSVGEIKLTPNPIEAEFYNPLGEIYISGSTNPKGGIFERWASTPIILGYKRSIVSTSHTLTCGDQKVDFFLSNHNSDPEYKSDIRCGCLSLQYSFDGSNWNNYGTTGITFTNAKITIANIRDIISDITITQKVQFRVFDGYNYTYSPEITSYPDNYNTIAPPISYLHRSSENCGSITFTGYVCETYEGRALRWQRKLKGGEWEIITTTDIVGPEGLVDYEYDHSLPEGVYNGEYEVRYLVRNANDTEDDIVSSSVTLYVSKNNIFPAGSR